MSGVLKMENKNYWKEWNKYLLYGLAIALLIIISIEIREVSAVVSGIDYTTFWLTDSNSSSIGVFLNGRTALNTTITANSTSISQNRTTNFNEVGGAQSVQQHPGVHSSLAWGNGTWYTPNFSIPVNSFQAVNGTWEVSVAITCQGTVGAVRPILNIFKFNSTGEYNLTGTQNTVHRYSGFANASLNDICIVHPSGGVLAINDSIRVPAQFDTGFTNLTGNDRVGIRIGFILQNAGNNNLTIMYNNTGSFVKITNVTTIGPSPAGDSCTYSSGNWVVNWYDNCTVSSLVNLNGNDFIINGRNGCGTFILNADIININKVARYGLSTQNCTISYRTGVFKR